VATIFAFHTGKAVVWTHW